eukprot:438235-Pyramimonas_sp.AAC.1
MGSHSSPTPPPYLALVQSWGWRKLRSDMNPEEATFGKLRTDRQWVIFLPLRAVVPTRWRATSHKRLEHPSNGLQCWPF